MNKEILSGYALEIFEALKNLLDEIPIIAGDSRHDALSMRIFEAESLMHRITDEPELKPCPFCGCTNIRYEVQPDISRITCMSCDIGTGWVPGQPNVSVQRWNRRCNDA